MALIKIKSESMNLADDYTFTGTINGVVGAFGNQLFHMQHIEASSVGGGNASSGFNDRVLNSTVVNQISGASLSSNQFTLPSGTYILFAQADAHTIDRNYLAIYNVTNSGLAKTGQSNYSGGDTSTANIWCRLTPSSTQTFKLQHYAQTANTGGQGFGVANLSTTNTYVNLLIWKVD